jgi:hypothetical protein
LRCRATKIWRITNANRVWHWSDASDMSSSE